MYTETLRFAGVMGTAEVHVISQSCYPGSPGIVCFSYGSFHSYCVQKQGKSFLQYEENELEPVLIKLSSLQGTFTKLSPEFCAIVVTNSHKWNWNSVMLPNLPSVIVPKWAELRWVWPQTPIPQLHYYSWSMHRETIPAFFGKDAFPPSHPSQPPLHLFSQPTHFLFLSPCSTVKPVLISTFLWIKESWLFTSSTCSWHSSGEHEMRGAHWQISVLHHVMLKT